MTRTQFAQLLTAYHPYVLKEDGMTDLLPALDGGYRPSNAAIARWTQPAPVPEPAPAWCGDDGYRPIWSDPAPVRQAPRSPFAAPPRPSFWKLYGYALLSSVSICLIAWAIARLVQGVL